MGVGEKQAFPNLDAQLIASVHSHSVVLKRIFPFLLLAIVVFGVYGPALGNGFVWDYRAYSARPVIRSCASFRRFPAFPLH